MLRFSFRLFLTLLLMLMAIGCFVLWQSKQPKPGRHVFDIKGNVSNFEINGIEFANKDNVWQIKNLENFYADTSFVKEMLFCFDNSTYVKEVKKPDDIKFDTLIVDDKRYKIAKNIIKQNNTYWITSCSLFAKESGYMYLMRPITNIDYEDVGRLFINDVPYLFIDRNVVSDINNLDVLKVKKAVNSPLIKTVKLVLKTGVVFTIKYYEDGWFSVNYDKDVVYLKGVKEFVEAKNLLTKDYFFKYN